MPPPVADLWPGRPRLLEGESFSSWFARVAAANGLRPADLYRILQPGGGLNPKDLDRHGDIHLIERLAEKTGVAKEKLEQATFRRWAGWVFERDDGLVKLDWLPPAGREKAKRCFGQQVCPSCLAEDDTPYLRLEWRLSFMTVCPKHGRLLLDRCPACNEPFSILRQSRSQREVRCWSCGDDVRHFVGDAPPLDVVPVQQDLLNLVTEGWRGLGAYGPVYSFAALKILALVARRVAGGRHAYRMREWIGAQDPRLAVPPETLPRVHDWALLTPRARCVLIAMAHHLFEDWPHRFTAAAQSVGMASTYAYNRFTEDVPFAYAHAVEWHLKKPFKADARYEVASAKGVLERRGVKPTYRNLIELVGTKLLAMSEMAEPVAKTATWGQGRYWKLDGVSAEVKEAARVAAHRSGENVAAC